jgi:hypothetical protein
LGALRVSEVADRTISVPKSALKRIGLRGVRLSSGYILKTLGAKFLRFVFRFLSVSPQKHDVELAAFGETPRYAKACVSIPAQNGNFRFFLVIHRIYT